MEFSFRFKGSSWGINHQGFLHASYNSILDLSFEMTYILVINERSNCLPVHQKKKKESENMIMYFNDSKHKQVYFKFFLVLQSEIFKLMDHKAIANLETSLSILRKLFMDLHQHRVSIEVLGLVTSKKEIFLTVTDLFEQYQNDSLPMTSSAYRNLLSCREKDLKTLNEVIRTVETLQMFFEEISESKFYSTYCRHKIYILK